jgi:hypothetical protein
MDIQKTMEFILEQNAATAANLQQFSIEMKELKAKVALHEEDLQIHTEWKIEMSQALQDLAGQMKDGFRQTAKAHRELAEAHQATEESLNILIRTVQDILPRLPKQ